MPRIRFQAEVNGNLVALASKALPLASQDGVDELRADPSFSRPFARRLALGTKPVPASCFDLRASIGIIGDDGR